MKEHKSIDKKLITTLRIASYQAKAIIMDIKESSMGNKSLMLQT
jgi:hypothetical protein